MCMFVGAYVCCTYSGSYRSHYLFHVSGCTLVFLYWLFQVFPATPLLCVVRVWGYGTNGFHSPLGLMGRMGLMILEMSQNRCTFAR